MADLIDTTEMYLRTVYELEEEGIVPMRARIAERLHHSGPTVSQTVARMQRDGLIVVSDDRHLELTAAGREAAMRVMRKHRLAECLLVNVIGMPWEEVHEEACRWEHVMSDAVERRVYAMLDQPSVSPFGNPIPGLHELEPEADIADEPDAAGLVPLSDLATDVASRAVIRRIAELVQDDIETLGRLHALGVMPGAVIEVERTSDGVRIRVDGQREAFVDDVAVHLLAEPVA